MVRHARVKNLQLREAVRYLVQPADGELVSARGLGRWRKKRDTIIKEGVQIKREERKGGGDERRRG